MKNTINLFTIRDVNSQDVIYAEGIFDVDSISYFKITSQWITEKDKKRPDFFLNHNEYYDHYSYSEDVSYLDGKIFDKIYFSIEEYEFNSKFSLINHKCLKSTYG